jgi:hypothetical protein
MRPFIINNLEIRISAIGWDELLLTQGNVSYKVIY